MAEHLMACTPTGHTQCDVCGLCFRTWPPRGYRYSWLERCPGAPIYDVTQIPANLATRTQLAREGLRVDRAAPAGAYMAWTRRVFVLLYDRRQARPKRTLSAKQQVALAAAQAALETSRTCTRCGRRVQSKRSLIDADANANAGARLCVDCYDVWKHEQKRLTLYRWAADLFTRPVPAQPDQANQANQADGADRLVRILDTETTGLDGAAEVIEVAIVDLPLGEAILNTLVRPQGSIPLEATRVHGLRDADVADAPTLLEVWPQLTAALDGALVLAYNAPFDRQMLCQSAARYGLALPKASWEDVMARCAVLSYDGKTWLRLDDVCYEVGVAPGGHRALGDGDASARGIGRRCAGDGGLEPPAARRRDSPFRPGLSIHLAALWGTLPGRGHPLLDGGGG